MNWDWTNNIFSYNYLTMKQMIGVVNVINTVLRKYLISKVYLRVMKQSYDHL